MRINILEHKISDSKLEEEANKFADREAMMPYLIMNKRTFTALQNKVVCSDESLEFLDYKVLLNEDLRFGDVDIR